MGLFSALLGNAGAVNTSLDHKLITLANKDGRMTSTGTATAGDNASTFTYGGSSDTKTMTQLKYNLGLTLKSVGW